MGVTRTLRPLRLSTILEENKAMTKNEIKKVKIICHHWLDGYCGAFTAEEFATDVIKLEEPDFDNVMGLIDEYGLRGNGENDGLAMSIEELFYNNN